MAMMTLPEMKGLSVILFKAFLFQMSYKINMFKKLPSKEKLKVILEKLNKIVNRIIVMFAYFCVYKYLNTVLNKNLTLIILICYRLFKKITIKYLK